ncbi:MAG: hypothetical protein CVU17_00710 [Betaproteobacteria bacterium HGW-Betaproteobacteria-11]|nr:MAG: hypothetical protein CVU17_00710 [Betaproteobacteria bacterium HGW-Betaproteobacteria-11]
MPRRKSVTLPTSHLRRTIASAAARLMAEEGITDYATAKRKAARGLGADKGEALPSNEEIEIELRAWQALYQEDEHRERLRSLRATALHAMQLLAEFNPRLTGAVFDGTAGRYAPIHLQLFADSSKEVEIWLLGQQIPFASKGAPLHGNRAEIAEDRLAIELDETTILLDIFPPSGLRRPFGHQSAAAPGVELLLNPPVEEPPPR